jgi:hypothetical protein
MSSARRKYETSCRFEVLIALNVKVVAFWDVMVCGLVDRY